MNKTTPHTIQILFSYPPKKQIRLYAPLKLSFIEKLIEKKLDIFSFKTDFAHFIIHMRTSALST